MSDIIDRRDHWDKGLVRHLRLDPDAPNTHAFAIRAEHDGGLRAGGTVDTVYTLVIQPRFEDRADELRAWLERSPGIGGVFSPDRDIQ